MVKYVLSYTDCDACTTSIAISEKLEPLQNLMIEEAVKVLYDMYMYDMPGNDYASIKTYILDHIDYDNSSIDIYDMDCSGLCNPSFSISACYEIEV